MTGNPPFPPRATYRVQLGAERGLEAAAEIAGYLRDLGVSHLYASPFLPARRGSQHGYDITAHDAINSELGGEAAFDRLSESLDRHGLGLILDFVPNHMGVGRNDNPWWLDVLEWGRASPYADFFDIDWEPAKRELRGKVLLPFLGAHYGEVLEAGELSLRFDRKAGSFSVWYYEHRFPIGPRHYARILIDATAAAEEAGEDPGLRQLALGFRSLAPGRRRRAATLEQAAGLKTSLAALAAASASASGAIDAAVARFNGAPGDPVSFRPLHALLERQAYRLAYWRVASDEINYRRFFDINELAGLRVERDDLYCVMHRFVLGLIEQGRLHGLRIDHVDGLFDPRGYCRRLAGDARSAAEQSGRRTPYLVVEKILAAHEFLPEAWPIHGTTGYEFANQVGGLFVDPDGERPLTRIYRRATGDTLDFGRHVLESRRLVMDHLLASELQVLANRLDRIAEANWRTRDFTLNTLREVLREIVAAFPVYRTYVTAKGAGPEDRRDIEWAVSVARKHSAAPGDAFDFVRDVLTGDLATRTEAGRARRRIVGFAMKFQQFTSPVAAKGVEDTALYRYHRLVALNEVGGEPQHFGTSVSAFHRFNQERARRWPHTMLTTSTHDTKRGEDVRARLFALSELPQPWLRHLRDWTRFNRRHRRRSPDGDRPDRAFEYLIYQTLVGSWPLELDDPERLDIDRLHAYRERVQAYLVKAAREAKVNTSWTNPDADYEAMVARFVDRILDPASGGAFLNSFITFQRALALAGAVNGLAQTVAKLTSPGVPDLYQGSESWELSLVDPDNRRPVDFPRLKVDLASLRRTFGEQGEEVTPTAASILLEDWPSGLIKQFVVWRLLGLRRAAPTLFAEGSYLPLEVAGPMADRVCAFARLWQGELAIVVFPRLIAGHIVEAGRPLVSGEDWGETAVELPTEIDTVLRADPPRHLFTGAHVAISPGEERLALKLSEALGDFPVAVLVPGALFSNR
jgi:(1->4)-alpha-D-glucan 1-alpha-D-glucosylmutase